MDERLSGLDGWTITDGKLTKTWTFPDFATGLAFVNRVGELAEQANHHPDVFLAWGRVRIELWSHDVGGLTGRDFRLAKGIDGIG